jgi:hypothetical protein
MTWLVEGSTTATESEALDATKRFVVEALCPCGTVSVWLARTLGPAMSTSIVGIPVIKLKTTDLFILQRIASSLAPGHGSSRSGTRLLSVFSLVGFFVVARHITHAALASFASSRSELVL